MELLIFHFIISFSANGKRSKTGQRPQRQPERQPRLHEQPDERTAADCEPADRPEPEKIQSNSGVQTVLLPHALQGQRAAVDAPRLREGTTAETAGPAAVGGEQTGQGAVADPLPPRGDPDQKGRTDRHRNQLLPDSQERVGRRPEEV